MLFKEHLQQEYAVFLTITKAFFKSLDMPPLGPGLPQKTETNADLSDLRCFEQIQDCVRFVLLWVLFRVANLH